jgi:pimeloyl-ACP methyl ester carboxylesterase
MLHELPLLSVLRDAERVVSAMGAVVGRGMQAGGPPAALESFLRFAFGDQVVDGWPSAFRDRLLSNAEMVFAIELPGFQAYRPDADALARCTVPAQVLVGDQQELPLFREAAEWLARHLGTAVGSTPGAHGPQFTDPDGLVATIRAFSGRL